MKEKELGWSLFTIWNEMIGSDDGRVYQPRERIWASELGKAQVDIWYALRGETPTNPPNVRSRRKFMAGDFWEWFFVRIMMIAGIFQSSQDYIQHQYDGLLNVSGKLDIKAGGKPDYKKSRENIDAFFAGDESNFGIKLKKTLNAVVDHLESKFGDRNLKDIIIEVKSCSGMMFDKYERTGKANPNHVLQLYHYLKGTDMDEGHVFYVSKDDCRVMEFGVWKDSPVEQDYFNFIKSVSEFHKSNTQPPIEPLVVFDWDDCRFFKNWKVEYSMYLTKLYGFEDPEHYRTIWDGEVASLNRTFKRAVDVTCGVTLPKSGKLMQLTPNNLDVIAKTKATLFPQWEDMVARGVELSKEGKLVDTEEEVIE